MPPRLSKPSSLFLGATLTLFAPSLAHADEPSVPAPRFGDAGQVALHLNDGLAASVADIFTGPQIQLDYFVTDHLSLGVTAGVNWYHQSALSSGEGHSFVFRLGPRVGYDIPISPYVSFWPQLGVDYQSDNETTFASSETPDGTSTSTSSQTTSSFAFVAVAPFVFHPVKGFFIGAGPAFNTQISNSTSGRDNPKQTSLGLMATVGGAL